MLLCTTKFAQSHSQYYFVLQSLHKALPSTSLYYKVCTKSFPVLLCTTKLAKSTSQYYFVLQSLHKARSQYYFVLQSLHKVVPSTTLYYKACTKSFPVLLCTTKLAQSTFPVLLCTTKLAQSRSQNYFVLQSLHKALPSTPLYYQACTQNDMTTCLETFKKERFCSFPHRHGIDDPTTTRRRRNEPLEANKGPAPRPPDYKREPFATPPGKNTQSDLL